MQKQAPENSAATWARARFSGPPRRRFHASRITSHVRGFTLIELMAVISIIGILAGIVLAAASYAHRQGCVSKTSGIIYMVSGGLDMNKADLDWFPPDTYAQWVGERIWPSMSLWFHLQYCQEQGIGQSGSTPHKPYVKFRADQLSVSTKKVSGRPDFYMNVVDAWGRPLNFKAYLSSGYSFGTTAPGDTVKYAPRHNRNTYDLCSYGANGTTWQKQDKVFEADDLSLEGGSGAIPPDYFYKPFDTLSAGHCYGGEEGDDINNWQRR